jgi:inositol-1,3,4-trisphosphate 5/6-kinase/inositol-tetrakisphosphate 1-kinase
VYIIGEAIQVVRRFSVPDVNTYDLLNNVGIYRLPRVSCAAASADHADLDPRIAGGSSAIFSILSFVQFSF